MLDPYDKSRLNEYLERSELWELCGILLKAEENRYKEINLENLKKALYYAVEHIEKIKKVLPEYTEHGMQHSCNVLDIMWKLLENMDIIRKNEYGQVVSDMSSYETALLILSAFFHDIGMGLLDGDVSGEVWYRAYRREMLGYDEEVLKKLYIRKYHHLRVKIFLDNYSENDPEFQWVEANGNKKNFVKLNDICKSHNEGKDALEGLDRVEG